MSNKSSICPICEAQVSMPANTDVSEIVNCADCSSRLVVEKMKDNHVFLKQAPAIEEDWGE